jgi:hypothetical protein
MNKLIILVLLIISVSCNTDSNQSNITYKNISYNVDQNTKKSNTLKEPYGIKYYIEETENNDFYLHVNIELHNNSHYISPHAKRDFKGKFSITLEDNDTVSLDKEILESPQSIEEIDNHPFVRGTVNWVRENTSYKQKIHINSKNDFVVKGLIHFTIEPRCTLEQIEFIIKYQSGRMIIEKFMC